MTQPTNTVLTDDEIKDIARCYCVPRDEVNLPMLHDVQRALIERLGASDAVPVAWMHTHRKTGEVRFALSPMAEFPFNQEHWESAALYDATALAQARQAGYEEARAELGPDAARYRFIRDGDAMVWCQAGDDLLAGDQLDAAIDAARQPAQKEWKT